MTCIKCGKSLQKKTVPLYKYRECGLDNVFLFDMVEEYICSCGKKYYEFPPLDIVYLAITYQILNQQTSLNAKQFRFLRKWAGLTAIQLTTLLGKGSRVTISNWERDRKPIPPATDHAMRMLVLNLMLSRAGMPLMDEVDFKEWLKGIGSKARPTKINIDSKMIEKFQTA